MSKPPTSQQPTTKTMSLATQAKATTLLKALPTNQKTKTLRRLEAQLPVEELGVGANFLPLQEANKV